MGRDTELFKAAKSGNNAFLERIFASCLKKGSGGFGSFRGKGANPNIQDESGYTLLHHATLHGQRETVSLLLKCGASTTIHDSSGSCPLHLAAWKGDSETVQILVTQGPSRANVNQQSYSDDTALHLASQYGYKDVVEFLLQRHADPLLTNIKGETPLDLAALYGHLDTVHLLISHCPEILQLSRPAFSPLHLAARNGHTLVALSLINAGIPINTLCARGTALHEAAMCGKADTVQLLLDKGINVALVESNGQTALELLEGYQAGQAKEIRKMIEEHLDDRRMSGEALKSPVDPPVIAVAQTSCSPITDHSGALPFSKGDKIAVQRKASRDIFIGTINGRVGSFLAQDVVFFKEKDGHLVPTDVSVLSRASSSDVEPRESLSPETSRRNVYEVIPIVRERLLSPDSLTSEDSSLTSPPPQPSGDEGDLEASTRSGLEQSHGTGKKPSKNRLSKKQKRFQLQKDDGKYAELCPIDPQDAKKDYGESLRLNPVGPTFSQVPGPSLGGAGHLNVSKRDSEIITTHNIDPTPSVAAPDATGAADSSKQYLGSYYVLEVGNFDSRRSAAVPKATGEGEGSEGEGKHPEQGAYYKLDVHNLGNDEQSQSSGPGANTLAPTSSAGGREDRNRSVSALSQGSYENVDLMDKQTPAVYENIQLTASGPRVQPPSQVRSRQAAATSPIDIPMPTRERKAVGMETDERLGVVTQGRPSSYHYDNVRLLKNRGEDSRPAGSSPENVRRMSSSLPVSIPALPPGLRKQSPVPAASSHSSHGSSQSYENVEQAFRGRKGSRNLDRRSESFSPPRSPSPSHTSSRLNQENGEDGGGGGGGGEGGGGGRGGGRGGGGGERAEGGVGEGDGEKGGGGGEGGKGREMKLPARPKSREQIYEAVSLAVTGRSKSQKRHKGTGSGPDQSVASTFPRHTSSSQPFHERNEQNAPTDEPSEGAKGSLSVGKDRGELSEGCRKEKETQTLIISKNPFAGLVISASRQLEESVSVQSELRAPAEVESLESARNEGRLVATSESDAVARVMSPENMRTRAETLWDDDRVEKEWTQIETVLKDVSGGLPTSPVGRGRVPDHRSSRGQSPGREIFMWLQGVGLGGYANVLETNGFDRIKFLNGSILATDDLHDIGITSEEDQLTIMAAVSLLPPPPRVRQATTVTEWLGHLELSHLQANFEGYSLQKLSTLWDIEVASVVGIELLGYRKRLQYGISELRNSHPDWEKRTSRPSMQSLDSSSPMDSVTFTKDYRNIKSKASPRSSPRTSAVSMETSGQDQVPSLLRQESDVTVRSPRQAQAKVGSKTDRDCKALPYESWKHPNTALIRETVNYQAKYLGSVVVVRVHGTQSTEEACLRLRTSTENMKKIPEIILAISWKGVKFVDAHTMNVVSTHAVRDISYCSQDIEDKRVFAYITKDKSGMYYCHVFMAASKEVADEVIMTIGQAFEIAYQKVMKARGKSPLR